MTFGLKSIALRLWTWILIDLCNTLTDVCNIEYRGLRTRRSQLHFWPKWSFWYQNDPYNTENNLIVPTNNYKAIVAWYHPKHVWPICIFTLSFRARRSHLSYRPIGANLLCHMIMQIGPSGSKNYGYGSSKYNHTDDFIWLFYKLQTQTTVCTLTMQSPEKYNLKI